MKKLDKHPEQMQNENMGIDPRSVANTILDIADGLNLSLSNLAINKILYFSHRDFLLGQKKRLISTAFEAWKYGPVVPVVYHEFKKFNNSKITDRATKLCRETGHRVIAKWDNNENWLAELSSMVGFYGKLSPTLLVELSHKTGGAWDHVWNCSESCEHGMLISDELILKYSENERISKYAH